MGGAEGCQKNFWFKNQHMNMYQHQLLCCGSNYKYILTLPKVTWIAELDLPNWVEGSLPNWAECPRVCQRFLSKLGQLSHDIFTMPHSHLLLFWPIPTTPNPDLNICGLRQIFCSVPHSCNICQLLLLVPSHHLCQYL